MFSLGSILLDLKDEESIKVFEKAEAEYAAKEKHRRDLFFSLSTRVLTSAEEKEAFDYGYDLNCGIAPDAPQMGTKGDFQVGQFYHLKALMEAWFQQRRLKQLEVCKKQEGCF